MHNTWNERSTHDMINSPGGVTGGCQDLRVTKETAAGQVACVGQTPVFFLTCLNERKLLFHLFLSSTFEATEAGQTKSVVSSALTCVCVQLPEGLGTGSLDVVHCADVIQPTAGHQVTRGGESNAHHPGGLQRHGNQLRGREFRFLINSSFFCP